MKKQLLVLLFILAGTCFAHFPVSVTTEDGNGAISASWTPIQLGIFPHEHLQIFRENTNVYGFSMGLLALNQESSVFSFAPMNGIKKNYFLQTGLLTGNSCNYGISLAAINMVGRNYGLQLGVFNIESNFGDRYSKDSEVPGISIGLFNISGSIQIGLLNYNPQGFIPYFPLFNFPVKK